ncbi:MAG: class I SAM-dependent methyltransferase [Bdellovibrionaceae bacterium]|nr:class I SAM-dependent methyltransferase [Pseudobdellovibrionaceae bacterium]MBX3034225.1 class I SAM-dependent methyltransferase [Pseudobdellovibrionaceae bacterium]
MRFQDDGDLLFVEKITGFNTHAPDAGKRGLLELLEAQTGRKLFVVHRLDKETSGAMVFAQSKEAAADMAALFEKHLVRKRYLLLTDRRRSEETFTAASRIEKKGASFVSDPNSKDPNSRTLFRKLKSLKIGDLWEALPETGKPHQIRLHATDRGIPILGDAEHGGSPFARLCLHSKFLGFNWRGAEKTFEASTPAWSNDLEAPQAQFLDAVQSRSHLFDLSRFGDECLRLAHQELAFCRVDQFGPQLWVYWYAEADPSADFLKFLALVSQTAKKSIFVRHMHNRGRDPNRQDAWLIGDVQDVWQARENGVRFELRTDSGQSPGLFLDQRENRRWVRRNSGDRKVLNLFSYTGGFSVNAALGGADEVCTVDVSGKFNDWTMRNFEINSLDPRQPLKYEFWNQDCLLFLKGAAKRGRKWDLIICDPPSFGRSKEGTFQIQRQLPPLLDLCLSCLEKNGRLLFSSNYEGWTLEDLRQQILVNRSTHQIAIEPTPPASLDFERPDTEPLMKSLILVKR